MSDFGVPFESLKPFADVFDTAEAELSYQDKANHAAKEFAEEITKRGYTRLYRPAFDPDAVADIAHALDRQAFEPTAATILAHPKQVMNLRDYLTERRYTLREKNECHGVEIKASQALPKNRLVAVHPKAIMSDRAAGSFRPWFIARPKGVVSVAIHGGEQ